MADRLVADVGATNTRVGLAGANGLRRGTARSFANDGFAGLAPLLARYIADAGITPAALCAGVAGPVRDGAARLTNRDWVIDPGDLAAATGARDIHLLNDLQAQGYALDDIAPDSLTPIRAGRPDPAGPRMVLGLGSGCNIAVVHRVAGRLFVPPAEAGHAALPHMDDATNALITRLGADAPHKPAEAALSGPGLTRLHAARTGRHLTPAGIIAAHRRGAAAATETLQVFTALLGTRAGDLALTHMATGGLFLIGGTARAVAPVLAPQGFAAAFTAKGPYTDILHAIPVTLVTDDNAALAGCARCLRDTAA